MISSRIRIDSVNLSAVLSEAEFKSIPVKKFRKDNIIYDDGTLTLYVFKSGRAKAIIYEGDEAFILYYLTTNNIIIPEDSCAIEFTEDSEVFVIDANKFSHFFENSAFATAVINSLKQRAVMERRIIKNLAFKSCKNRLAAFLLEITLSQNGAIENEMTITMDLSIKELSAFIGSKRQTVSTLFNTLIRDKILIRGEDNQYIVNKVEKLYKWKVS
ncbi:Crp/Fnr family transcriptional regulator [Sulfurospirillum sp. 1612]|uniref:Crp/Fnr family transcriptional regulator n=1 Tax=Sulfurospirillum sp. 1612 TaxID=3094835 RepID=UPI002F93D5FC